MKSLKYISVLAFALALTSCSYDLPNPPDQTNTEPEFFFQNNDLEIEKEGQAYNLQELNEKAQELVVAKVTKLNNFPEQYSLSADVQVGNDAAFTKCATIPATITNNEISVLPTLMNSAIQQVITKAPGTYNPYVRVVAYAERGTTRIRLGGLTNSYVNLPYQITTFNPSKVIEQNYYFYNATDKKTHKMDNILGPSVNAYDSPEFIYLFDAPASNMDWYIIPESAMNPSTGEPNLSQAIGCIPSEDVNSGKLVTGGKAGTLGLSGPARLVINVETDAYNLTKACDFLYVISGSNTAKKAMLLSTSNYVNYSGFATLEDGYYLAGQPSYQNEGDIVFYQNKKLGFTDTKEAEESTVTRSGYMTLTKETLNQLTAPFKDVNLYYMEANTVWMTYSVTALRTIQVEVDGQLYELIPNETSVMGKKIKKAQIWTSDGKIDLKSGFKFWANGHNVATIGAAAGQLLTGEAGTLQCEVSYQGEKIRNQGNSEIGSYQVTLDFTKIPYTVTLTK